jgi:hypothetical protein
MKTLAIVAAAAACTLLVGTANAAPLATTAPANQSLVQQAHHWHGGWGGWGGPRVGIYIGPGYGYGAGYGYGYGGCGGVRHMCANRWGWGGPGFGRCLWRHGC